MYEKQNYPSRFFSMWHEFIVQECCKITLKGNEI